MNPRAGGNALILSVCVLALALGGCGGGSGGTGARPDPNPAAPPLPPPPPPPPAPPPPPPPPAGPTGINFDDAEYRLSNAAVVSGSIAAWQAGGTGQGVKVAVVDSGINPGLVEFAGRIDPASQDVAASRGITDTEGHGSAVAGVIAANRNGSSNVGMAFESRIISLNTANPNNCDPDDGCKHFDRDIAAAVDIATSSGARVVNISLGGESLSLTMRNAIGRAASAGVVVVMSAGNDGDPDPGGFALGSAQNGNGLVIIAGAMDEGRQIASFSNRAGSGMAHYLTALGVRVRTIDQFGRDILISGTSFAAPTVSGAVALLASAFPNLSGAQIVRILLDSAADAGTPGDDTVYGQGVLDVAAAFRPLGATAMGGSGAPVPVGEAGEAGGAMGDAVAAEPEMAGAIILDGYSRAFATTLATRLAPAPQERPLGQALQITQRTAGIAAGMTAVSITVDRKPGGQPSVGLAQLGLTREDSRQARVLAGLALSRLSPRTALAMGFAESGRTLQQHLAGRHSNAFLVARDPMGRLGFHADAAASLGVRHDFGLAALTLAGERGKVWRPGADTRQERPGYGLTALTLDRAIGPAAFSLGGSRLREEETVLGGRLSPAYGLRAATSWFADAAAAFDLGGGWGAKAGYRRGWTALQGSGALAERGRLVADAWSFDLSKHGAFAAGDRLALRIMQPLRVRSGGLTLNLPVSYDYADGSFGYERRFFNLAPTGREIDVEAAYGLEILGGAGHVDANAFVRRQPGHIAAASDDLGAAIRFTLGF